MDIDEIISYASITLIGCGIGLTIGCLIGLGIYLLKLV